MRTGSNRGATQRTSLVRASLIIKGKREGGLWTRVVSREAGGDVGGGGWPEELARGCSPGS